MKHSMMTKRDNISRLPDHDIDYLFCKSCRSLAIPAKGEELNHMYWCTKQVVIVLKEYSLPEEINDDKDLSH